MDMTLDPTRERPAGRTLRLWPGVVLVSLQWLVRLGVPAVVPGGAVWGVLGGLGLGLLVLLWWVLFSRAPWSERLLVPLVMVVAFLATRPFLHESIAGGMMGMFFFIQAPPMLCAALVLWAASTRRLGSWPRRTALAVALLLGCSAFLLVRTGGLSGEADSELHWRWTATPEERLLAGDRGPRTAAASSGGSGSDAAEAEWPGFRGPARDGVVRGVRIGTDWATAPPVEMWRRPVGPAWSSFAVQGDVLFTQEQRGDEEAVSCYRIASGEPVWRHGDPARFWESNAGAGPRGTPTLRDGRVYTFGATGILNALDARDGAVLWSRNPPEDTQKKTPGWGFASSPLVIDDLVVVATAGVLAAYDAGTGERRWTNPTRGYGYSSPHRVTIGGVEQIVLLNGTGAIGVAPADGTLLWEHAFPGDGIVQPGLTGDGDILIGSGSGLGSGTQVGIRRIAVEPAANGWTVHERWTSTGLKPYFNDFVVHRGHAFGFDGALLSCIDLASGERRWKGGRYGHGQLVLLAEQGLLLVLSENGEIALVAAEPSGFTELGRAPALSDKTWNHPVVVRDVLLVRNDREMAAFRLAPPS
jgi:outer membrane protein assembly factor BamB